MSTWTYFKILYRCHRVGAGRIRSFFYALNESRKVIV